MSIVRRSNSSSPLQRWMNGENNNPEVTINVHYTDFAGSDPAVMQEIGERINSGMPVALRADKSVCIFVPANLTAYWFGRERSYFEYSDMQSFIDGIKLQYLTHKELLSTDMLLSISQAIMCQNNE